MSSRSDDDVPKTVAAVLELVERGALCTLWSNRTAVGRAERWKDPVALQTLVVHKMIDCADRWAAHYEKWSKETGVPAPAHEAREIARHLRIVSSKLMNLSAAHKYGVTKPPL